jgi:hypothetical protein
MPPVLRTDLFCGVPMVSQLLLATHATITPRDFDLVELLDEESSSSTICAAVTFPECRPALRTKQLSLSLRCPNNGVTTSTRDARKENSPWFRPGTSRREVILLNQMRSSNSPRMPPCPASETHFVPMVSQLLLATHATITPRDFDQVLLADSRRGDPRRGEFLLNQM